MFSAADLEVGISPEIWASGAGIGDIREMPWVPQWHGYPPKKYQVWLLLSAPWDDDDVDVDVGKMMFEK